MCSTGQTLAPPRSMAFYIDENKIKYLLFYKYFEILYVDFRNILYGF